MPASSPTDPPEALRRYRADMARARRTYVLLTAAGLVLLLIAVGFFWMRGALHQSALSIARTPEPVVPDAPLASQLAVAWTSPDATATGTFLGVGPTASGTVVTYSQHTVTGRHALTGEARWTYTRSNIDVCGVQVQDGITLAFFGRGSLCDEVIGLDTATGARKWNRTLMDNQRGLITSRTGSIALTSPTRVQVISPAAEGGAPAGGWNRWVYEPEGCSVNSSVLGEAGVLVATSCTPAGGPANGLSDADDVLTQPTLVLRKPAEDADAWKQLGVSATPLLAESNAVLGWDRDSAAVLSFSANNGTRLAAVSLPGCGTADTPRAVLTAGSIVALCNGTLSRLLVEPTSIRVVWSMPATGLPVQTSATETTAHSAVVPTAAGLVTTDLVTGAAQGGPTVVPATSIDDAARASHLARIGPGLLLGGERTVMLQPA